MRPLLPLALCATVGLSACAAITESRFNPLNWFGRSEQVATAIPRDELRPLVRAGDVSQLVEGRVLISQITGLQVDRTPSGAIVTARGLAPTQGYFNAQLVRIGRDNGTLIFDFRVEAPTGFEPVGSAASRQITSSVALSNGDLAGIRSILVNAQSGARRVSR